MYSKNTKDGDVCYGLFEESYMNVIGTKCLVTEAYNHASLRMVFVKGFEERQTISLVYIGYVRNNRANGKGILIFP